MPELEVKKLIIMGDGAIGKTCLLQVFQKGEFPETYLPTVLDNDIKKMKHPTEEGKEFILQLWDTAGQVKFHNNSIIFNVLENLIATIQEAYEEARAIVYPGTEVLLIGFSFVSTALHIITIVTFYI